MHWGLFFVLAVICLISTSIFALIRAKQKYKSGRILDSTKIMFIGVIASSILLFIPIYTNTFESSNCGVFETILISIHNMIRLFIVDGEFEFITSNLSALPEWLFKGYTFVFSILFVLAPLLTFNFVLSFFKNASAYQRYFRNFNTDVFIFSELNDKSVALANSLHNNEDEKRFFVFTDVFDDDEQSLELIEQAKEIGAVCFKKDITSINFARHSKKSSISFFVIGEDESENVSHTLSIIGTYRNRDNTNLYIFSKRVEAEMLLAKAFITDSKDGAETAKIKVRRVNDVRSLVYRTLYQGGYKKIFDGIEPGEDGIKWINAVVIGMGHHGTEMTKALSWLCQMDGYRVRIDSFDLDKMAEDKFKSLCPELMSDKFNGVFDVVGEAGYKITVHSGIDVNTKTFDDLIESLPRATYVFVALGNDEMNISTAIKLRSLYARLGCNPNIDAVVYDSEKKEALADITNFKKQKYEIDFIGDLKMSYSEDVILDSEVEKKALARHIRWGTENEFWQYDYNYKSSIASAIHREMKSKNGIPGIDKDPKDRTEEELWNIRILEHCRWNAYMRSEGYVYSGSPEKSSRNDLAKMHHCLVPFYDLPYEEQIKDDD